MENLAGELSESLFLNDCFEGEKRDHQLKLNGKYGIIKYVYYALAFTTLLFIQMGVPNILIN